MKKPFLFLMLLALLFSSCYKKDIDALKKHDKEQDNLIAALQNTVNTINGDVKALQSITEALQKKISVVSYNATATGYTLTMSDGSTIELKNGANGKDGTNGQNGADAPRIGVKQDADGEYYWTLAGAFILQDGKKLRVTGNNGKDGQDGTNGSNGVTPQLRVDNNANEWLISYDGGNTWQVVKDKNGNPVPATGPQGNPGNPGTPGQTGPQGPAGIPGFDIKDMVTTIEITYQGIKYTLPKKLEKMMLTTSLQPGPNAVIKIGIDAAFTDQSGVWIDLNNNGQQDAGEKVQNFGQLDENTVSYPLANSQTVTIYGKVTYFNCSENQISNLDLSENMALTTLWCRSNQLSALDLSKNTALNTLVCSGNQFSALDLSKNTELRFLYCSGNQFSALDVSKNTALTELVCSGNQLSALDLSKNIKLTFLDCLSNQLSALDLSKNTALNTLYCTDNQLSALDLSKNTALADLDCRYNQISALDISKNTELVSLDCNNNQIKVSAMNALLAGLHANAGGKTATIYSEYISDEGADGNATPASVSAAIQAAKDKGWNLYKYAADYSMVEL